MCDTLLQYNFELRVVLLKMRDRPARDGTPGKSSGGRRKRKEDEIALECDMKENGDTGAFVQLR